MSLLALPDHIILLIAQYMPVAWFHEAPYPEAKLLTMLTKDLRWLNSYRVAVLLRISGLPRCRYLTLDGMIDGPSYYFDPDYVFDGYAFFQENDIRGDCKMTFLFRGHWYTQYNNIRHVDSYSFHKCRCDDKCPNVYECKANRILHHRLNDLDPITFQWIKRNKTIMCEDEEDEEEDIDPNSIREWRMYYDGVIKVPFRPMRHIKSLEPLTGISIKYPLPLFE